jgi:hypothetical protein
MPDRWGISEAYFIAIGQIIIAFQRLDWGLGYTVFILKGEKGNIAKHVAADMFAAKLKLCENLFQERIGQFGERGEGLGELFKEAYLACEDANKARNGIIHAQYGFTTKFDFVIEDLKGKAPGLPIIKPADDSPTELVAIVEQIEQADAKLMEFIAQFLGHYLDEYTRGYALQPMPSD